MRSAASARPASSGVQPPRLARCTSSSSFATAPRIGARPEVRGRRRRLRRLAAQHADQHHERHDAGEPEQHAGDGLHQVGARLAVLDRREQRRRRFANVGGVVGHERDQPHRRARQRVRLLAALRGVAAGDLALDAIRNLERRNRHVVAERVLGDQAQAIVVLEEPLARRHQIAGVRAAEHFERRQLHDRRIELRKVGHDLVGFGFDDGAGQREAERLAGPHRARRRPPPAGDRLDFDHVDRGLGLGAWGLGKDIRCRQSASPTIRGGLSS